MDTRGAEPRALAAAPPPRVAHSGARLFVAAALVGLAYYAGAQVGFALRFPGSPVSMLWPPNTLLLAAFLLTPMRRWWACLLAALPAHLLVQIQHGVPLAAMVGLFLTNTGQGLLGAAALRRCVPGPYRLDSLRRVWLFLACAAVLAPLAIAFLAAALIVATGFGTGYWLTWRAQFLSNVLSVLTLAPAILALAASGAAWLRPSAGRRWAEAGALVAGLLAACWLMFGPALDPRRYPALLYLPLPLLLWAALRFGTGGLAAAVLLVGGWAVAYAAEGPGPFGVLAPFENVVSLQLYLIAVTVPLLALAALFRERERAEAALRASEERYRTVVEAAPIAIVTQDAAGHLLGVNPAWGALLGYRPEDFAGRDLWELTHPDDVPRNRALLEELRAGAREGFAMEKRYYHRDGRVVWGQLAVAAVRDAGGRLRQTVGMVEDITARKRAEEALREAHEFRARILASTITAIAAFDREGRITLVNGRVSELTGYPAAELLGRTPDFLTPPAQREAIAGLLGATLRTGAQAALDQIEVRRKDGTARWVNVGLAPLTAGGAIVGAVGTAEDVTELRQAEAALRASDARFRALYDAGVLPICFWRTDGRITEANDAFLALLGFRRDELAAGLLPWDGLTAPEHRDRDQRALAEAVARGACTPYEKDLLLRDGRRVPVLAGGTLLPEQAGGVAFVLDLTERKQAEAMLRELSARLLRAQDEERRRIARELHDVTAQDLFAQSILLARLAPPAAGLDAPSRAALAEARALGEKALSDLRTQSYLLHPPLLEELGLPAALEWLVDGFARRSGIAVELTVDAALERPPEAVELALFRVAQEGLSNVQRHAGSATARIALAREGDAIRLRVEDRGQGIAADGAAASPQGSAPPGVGIPGMRERLRQLGGHLAVVSNAQGTTITAIVPLQEERAP